MPFVFTSLGSRAETTARSEHTCEFARAPANNTLVVVAVLVSDTAGTPAQPTGVVGAGLTFSLATSSVTYNPTTGGSQLHNLSTWRGMGTGLDTSVVTATFANNSTGCAILVTEVSGVSTAGTNGSSALSGSATSVNDTNSSITLFPPSAFSTANGWFSVVGVSAGAAQTPDGNWTTLDSCSYAGPSTGITSGFTDLSDGTVLNWSGGANDNRGSIILEVVADNPAAGGGAVPSPYYASYYYPKVVVA